MPRAPLLALILAVAACDGAVAVRDPGDAALTDAGGIPAPRWVRDAGAAGADAGSVAPDAGATDAGVRDAGPAPADAGPDCVSGSAPWTSYTVSAGDLSRGVRMDLDLGVAYRTLTVELEVEPGQWQPDCYNPASGRNMSPFQVLLSIRKGARWCRGGNLGGISARGPTNDDLWVQSYYAESVGSSCSGTQHDILSSRPNSPLELGVATPVRFFMDTATREVQVEVGSVMRAGTMDPRLELVSRAGEELHLFTSLDRSVECYAPGGGTADECCHLSAFGWTYSNLRYTACR